MDHGFVSFIDYNGDDCFGVFHPRAKADVLLGEVWAGPGNRLPIFNFDMKRMEAIEPKPVSELIVNGKAVNVQEGALYACVGFIGLHVNERDTQAWCGGKIIGHVKLCYRRLDRFETTFCYVAEQNDGSLKLSIPA
jgi:hypothetical protein